MGMLIQIFLSQIYTLATSETNMRSLIGGLKEQYNTICSDYTTKDPKFDLKPLLFTKNPAADTYYSLFDDYLAKPEEVCFDTTTGEPCPGSSQAATYLYDITEGLKNTHLDERVLNFYMRRFIYFLDQINSSDSSLYPQKVLNIPEGYSRVLLDATEVECCFYKYIYNTEMLNVFAEFLGILKAEIASLLQAEELKIKKNALQDKDCTSLKYYYLCTLNQTTDFFNSLSTCAKSAPSARTLTESKIICVNISADGTPAGARINNYIFVSSGPATTFTLRSAAPQATPQTAPEAVVVEEIENINNGNVIEDIIEDIVEEQTGASQYFPCRSTDVTDYAPSINKFNSTGNNVAPLVNQIPISRLEKFCPPCNDLTADISFGFSYDDDCNPCYTNFNSTSFCYDTDNRREQEYNYCNTGFC